jgi:hypothetical protein
MAEDGGFHEPRPDRLDRIEGAIGAIQGLITLAHEQQKTAQDMLAVIKESRAEIELRFGTCDLPVRGICKPY